MQEHHDVCENNWVCNRLALRNFSIQPPSPPRASQAPKQSIRKKKPAKRMDVVSMLNDELAQEIALNTVA
ncbi:hypothetical protein H0H92_011225, partial [Tricholoma furcatifolium]